MREQYAGSVGDYSPWINTWMYKIQFKPVLDHEDQVFALLTSSPIAPNEDVSVRLNLMNAVDSMLRDLLRHGRTIIGGNAETIDHFEYRQAWPLLDVPGGWVIVQPQNETQNADGRPDTARLVFLQPGSALIQYRNVSDVSDDNLQMTINDIVKEETEQNYNFAVGDRFPLGLGGHGTGISDRLIELAIHYVRRESGIDNTLDKYEFPLQQIKLSMLIQVMKHFGVPPDKINDPEQVKKYMSQAIQTGVVNIPDGANPMSLLTWDASMTASFDFLMRLDMVWKRITGRSMIAPSGMGPSEVPSGIAVARIDADFTAKNQSVQFLIHSLLNQVRGIETEWGQIDSIAGATTEPADTIDPEVL